jgi:hypothetical protein
MFAVVSAYRSLVVLGRVIALKLPESSPGAVLIRRRATHPSRALLTDQQASFFARCHELAPAL